MPNGVDKNFWRLLAACAVYRQRYEQWPTQARLHPMLLWDLAQIFDGDQFGKLATHLQLRTRDKMGLSVGGLGTIDYSDVDHGRLDQDALRLAEEWLDVQLRRDLEHP
jgi:hypothetical protein